jgi:DNA-binding transcriptional MerR regulator
MTFDALKVGDLAKRTGLTVRTLHHYDEIGLLRPSLRTEAGHRLYTSADIARLHQVMSLRQLGFSLEEIGQCLMRSEFSAIEVINLHLAKLARQIELQCNLRDRLRTLLAHFQRAGTVSAEEFLQTIEVMTMMEQYYTPEQMEYLRQRKDQLGDEAMQKAGTDWSELIAQVRAEMDKGTDPANPSVQALAARWKALVDAFTGGNPGIEQSVKKMWNEQGDNLVGQFGMQYDPRPVAEYIAKAFAATKKE